jgi:hypothetical protein
MGYPDRIGQSLGWLSLVFLLRFARSHWIPANEVALPSAPPLGWRDGWRDLVPMCLLGFTAGSVYPGMSPLMVILALATFGFAALVALKRRNLRPLVPVAIACGALLLVVLPVLAVRLLAALPAPGIEANLSTYSPRLRVIVFHGYPFIDPRTWFGGTLVTIGTVGTICMLGRARRRLLDGDAGAALLWGGVLFVPAVMATPLVTGSSPSPGSASFSALSCSCRSAGSWPRWHAWAVKSDRESSRPSSLQRFWWDSRSLQRLPMWSQPGL